jgi:hypothetical protein
MLPPAIIPDILLFVNRNLALRYYSTNLALRYYSAQRPCHVYLTEFAVI